MRALLDTIGGLFELLRLGALSGFRIRGEYWTWRWHTAFGRGQPATRRELAASVLEYARWVRRMRRGD